MYFVYYNCGWCNDGSHDVGLEEFNTMEQVEAFIKEIGYCDGPITVIEGREVKVIVG